MPARKSCGRLRPDLPKQAAWSDRTWYLRGGFQNHHRTSRAMGRWSRGGMFVHNRQAPSLQNMAWAGARCMDPWWHVRGTRHCDWVAFTTLLCSSAKSLGSSAMGRRTRRSLLSYEGRISSRRCGATSCYVSTISSPHTLLAPQASRRSCSRAQTLAGT